MDTNVPSLCEKCGMEFQEIQSFDQHILQNHTELSCENNSLTLLSETHTKRPQRKHKKTSTLKESQQRVNTKGKPDNPMKLNLKCKICDEKFKNHCDLKLHSQIHRDCFSANYKCSWTDCEEMFLNYCSLRYHLQVHKAKKAGLFCEECGKVFQCKLHFKNHMWIHTGEKLFSCLICQQQFSTNGQLTIHKRIHTGERPYKCEVCDKRFACASSRKKHQAIHTDVKAFQCDECGKKFKIARLLKIHQNVHNKNRLMHECNICMKTFTRRASVHRHMLVHGIDSDCNLQKYGSWTCEICSKTFIHKESLKRHSIQHSDNKCRFQCEKCEKKFTSRWGLKFHDMAVHSNCKPYICSICFKGYVQRSAVENHLVSHFKKGSSRCDLCNKLFCNEFALARHKKQHKKNKPFACALCGEGFCSKTSLQRHVQTKHLTSKSTSQLKHKRNN